jgi:hypothetical protein
MTYSMKKVRYSGVKDGNTSHNQVSTLRYRVPDHLSQFHRHISNFKVDSLLLKSFVSVYCLIIARVLRLSQFIA